MSANEEESVPDVRQWREEREPGSDEDGAPTPAQFLAAARRMYQKDGEIEIDEPVVVSRGSDPGAYIQAWVWVYNEDARALGQDLLAPPRIDKTGTNSDPNAGD